MYLIKYKYLFLHNWNIYSYIIGAKRVAGTAGLLRSKLSIRSILAVVTGSSSLVTKSDIWVVADNAEVDVGGTSNICVAVVAGVEIDGASNLLVVGIAGAEIRGTSDVFTAGSAGRDVGETSNECLVVPVLPVMAGVTDLPLLFSSSSSSTTYTISSFLDPPKMATNPPKELEIDPRDRFGPSDFKEAFTED